MNKRLVTHKKQKVVSKLFLRFMVTLVLSSASAFSQATNYTVSDFGDLETDTCDSHNDCKSLRAAITAANNSTDENGNTISLLANTYSLGIPGTDDDSNATGDLDVNSKVSLTIKGVGSTPAIIDANQIDRALHVNGTTLHLENVTIKNGYAASFGGGIFVNGALVTLTNSTVLKNTAGAAGGIYAKYGAVTLIDSTVSENIGDMGGGGIGAEGASVTLTNSTISQNETSGMGGGIFANAAVTLTNSLVLGNTASEGGGLGILATASVTLTNSVVSGNTAYNYDGGGISVYWLDNTVTFTLTNSTISGNTASRNGGGIFAAYGMPVTLINSTVSGNTAHRDGGGIYAYDEADTSTHRTAVTLIHSTVAGNDSSYYGNEIYVDHAILTLTNSVLAYSGFSDCQNEGGELYSGGFNWIENPGNCSALTVGSTTFSDPKLGALADNGGPVQTMLPQLGSGLIDGIDFYDACNLDHDARGVKRPQDGDNDGANYCDIGAVEVEYRGVPAPTPAMAGGYQHSCAVQESGAVYCWGLNQYGQLGVDKDTTPISMFPLQVSLPELATTAVAAGNNHTCVLTTTQHVYCWGQNRYGQLGNGTGVDSSTPVQVSGLTNVTSLTAGLYHTCASTASGNAYCWGQNQYAQLGNNSTRIALAPVEVKELRGNVVRVGAGFYHSCAVTNEAEVYCWGANSYGQIGNGSQTYSVAQPTQVDKENKTSMDSVASIAGGFGHTCAITTSAKAYCWGYNKSGQLGNGTTALKTLPVAVQGLSNNVAAITGGTKHSCALTTSGSGYCWGYNTSGQLGVGSLPNNAVYSSTPVAISGLTQAVAIAAGGNHTLSMVQDNAGYGWGENSSGQVGDGTTTNRKTPVNISFPMSKNAG